MFVDVILSRDIFIKSARGGHLRFWAFSKTTCGPFSMVCDSEV